MGETWRRKRDISDGGVASSAIQIYFRTTSYFNLNIHWLCTVVLNTERPPSQGKPCPPNRYTNHILARFSQKKKTKTKSPCISSIKFNLLSSIPFFLGPWNESWRDYFLGKLVEKPWCRQFPFWLQSDFHVLNITSSIGSGVSNESSAKEEKQISPQSFSMYLLQSYQVIDLNVSAICPICTFQTDLVIFFHFCLHAWSALEYWNNLESYLVCNSSINLSAETCSPAGN